MSMDLEAGRQEEPSFPIGYPSFAAFIASDKDKSTAIYRRFDRLAARNLLQLQDELLHLEARQDALDAAYFHVPKEQKLTVKDWILLKDEANRRPDGQDHERYQIALRIREVLKEYREALLQEKEVVALKKPTSRVLTAFKNEFFNVGSKVGSFPTLLGHSRHLFDNENDLLALKTPEDEDRLTGFLRYYFSILFVTHRTDHRMAYTSERRLQIAVGALNAIIAAILLFGAICNLYYVPSEKKRLALIALYTILFATCVGLLTRAKRPEVFAAGAAYAAVLVVFVSGGFGNGRKLAPGR